VDGSVRIEAGGEIYEAGTEDILVVPADVPHAFTNVGTERARMVNIHAAPKVVTEFVGSEPENVRYQYNHSS
jgi:mannose-6-phosphate isomerase-like protein (cupin superfamily)